MYIKLKTMITKGIRLKQCHAKACVTSGQTKPMRASTGVIQKVNICPCIYIHICSSSTIISINVDIRNMTVGEEHAPIALWVVVTAL